MIVFWFLTDDRMATMRSSLLLGSGIVADLLGAS
jgi:hypothetical protein